MGKSFGIFGIVVANIAELYFARKPNRFWKPVRFVIEISKLTTDYLISPDCSGKRNWLLKKIKKYLQVLKT